MSIKKPHVHADVIKYWADGHDIETLSSCAWASEWVPCPNPLWNENSKYRVKAKITHKIGNRYIEENTGSVYLLASVGPLQLALICINTGAHWAASVKVETYTDVTEKEFKRITGNSAFTLSKIND